MKGDFTRATFDPRHHFSQVLMQQGRVTLDADPNEQGAIVLHLLRALARDVFGPYAGPAEHAGFGLSLIDKDGRRALQIGAGRYYVEGILCECDGCDYLAQPHFVPAPAGNTPGSGDPLRNWLDSSGQDDGRFWLYLDVWERHVTALEMPHLREVALGGPDTCSRRQVVWQVRALEFDAIGDRLEQRIEALKKRAEQTNDEAERQRLEAQIVRLEDARSRLYEESPPPCDAPLLLFERERPALAARLQEPERLDDPCVTSPDSAYRGAENHLYRVEIHRGNENGAHATFKWSRDNGSVAARWIGGGGDRLEIANARDFRDRQWVEITDEEDDLLGRPGRMSQIASIEDNVLVLSEPQDRSPNATTKVRRWDHVGIGDIVLDDGAVPVPLDAGGDPKKAGTGWIALEDGIEVRFAPGGEYRSGDYWLIPARVATGDIEWPKESGQAAYRPPLGTEHALAPLGFVGRFDDRTEADVLPCQCIVQFQRVCGTHGRTEAVRTRTDVVVAERKATPTDVVVAERKASRKTAAERKRVDK